MFRRRNREDGPRTTGKRRARPLHVAPVRRESPPAGLTSPDAHKQTRPVPDRFPRHAFAAPPIPFRDEQSSSAGFAAASPRPRSGFLVLRFRPAASLPSHSRERRSREAGPPEEASP